MQKILQWYRQSTRNKIIVFSVIFIFALGYSFLHRPLGLIVWDRFQRQGVEISLNAIIFAAKNISINDNEEKFLNLYSHHNISQEKALFSKDILYDIDNLEIDLLTTTFFGLDELYLQSFLHKAKIYMLDYMLIDSFNKIYHDSSYAQEEIIFYQEFLNAFDKVFFFITKLAHKNHIYERYAIQVAVMRLGYIWFASNFEQEQICSLDKILFLERIQEAEQIFNTIDFNMWKDIETININAFELKDAIQTIKNVFKEKINEC